MNRKIATTLEEDFQFLGLSSPAKTTTPIVESADTAATPPAVIETAAAATTPATSVDEVKQVRVKKHTASERRKWKMSKRKGGAKAKSRKYRNKASVKKMLKKHRAKAGKMRHGKAAGRKRMVFTGLDQVANILENVQKVLSEIEKPAATFIPAFESVAALSQKMSEAISKVTLVEGLEDSDKKYLNKTSSEYAAVAKNALEVVATLKEGKETINVEDLEENFSLYLKALVEGLDLVADVLEDDSLTEAVNALAEGCDDDDDEDEDDDDDEDEDEDDDEDEGDS